MNYLEKIGTECYGNMEKGNSLILEGDQRRPSDRLPGSIDRVSTAGHTEKVVRGSARRGRTGNARRPGSAGVCAEKSRRFRTDRAANIWEMWELELGKVCAILRRLGLESRKVFG